VRGSLSHHVSHPHLPGALPSYLLPLTSYLSPLPLTSHLSLQLLLGISGGQSNPVGRLTVEADLERVLPGAGQGHVEDEHGAGLHVDHSGRWLAELHRALTAEQLGSRLVDEANPDGMNTDLGASPPNPEHQVSPGIYRREIGEPDVLKHAEHAELALLVDQGVVRDDCKVEVQGSGDSD
jgi:hypothetical protein